MITVYILAYNEHYKIKFAIEHYRARFPECPIIVYDNGSTDDTVQIAKENNCEVRDYSNQSGSTLNDGLHARIKSQCWKEAKTDWVIVSDLDELLDITQEELKSEESNGTSIIKTEAWTMVNLGNDYDLGKMTHGIRDGGYDKKMCFNRKLISDINYGVGCHNANPVGIIKFSEKAYIVHHYRDLNEDHCVNKAKSTTQRLSQDNRRFGWGAQCMRSEQELREDYRRLQKIAIATPPRRNNDYIIKERVA
jgi:glycosyltransferase involved in cell wall biosynthesis